MEGFIESGFRRVLVTLAAICCLVIVGFNLVAMHVAYNDIRGNMGVSLNAITRTETAFWLGILVIMPLCNWLSSQLGRRNFLLWAVVCFVLCSFFCGTATRLNMLIILRWMQGLGIGAMLVMSHTILTESWPVKNRATVQLLVVAAVCPAVLTAAPLAGYIVDNFGWPFVFFLNIPLGVIAGILVGLFVRKGIYEQQEDWLATGLLIAGAGCLYVGVERGQYEGELSLVLMMLLILLGVIGIGLFIWRQFRLLNVHLREGLVLITISSFFAGGQVVILHNSLFTFNEHVFLPVIVIAVVVAVITTVLIVQKSAAIRYLIAIGILVYITTWCLSLKALSGEMNDLVMEIRSVGAGILSVSLITLALSELEGREIGRGVAYFHVIGMIGGILSILVFVGLPYLWELFTSLR